MMLKRFVFIPALFLFAAILFSSCVTYKNVPYFKDLPDSSRPVIAKTGSFQSPLIQPDDILTVSIQALDPDVSAILNSGNITEPATGTAIGTSALSAGTPAPVSGYLVDSSGEIEIPFAGKIKVGGLTTFQAKETIRQAIITYVKSPIVNVRFANFKITVLGEVNRPSTYVIPNEKINLFDAIGMAGDLTIFGKRENVVLVRDTLDGEKEMVRLDLNSKNIVSSPYFYLRPNDLIYVEPNDSKILSLDAYRQRNYTIAAAVLSVIIVAATRIK